MNYQNQHFVTEAYLKAWRDPKTPDGAFVWVISKKERRIWRKSPRSLFSAQDFYTVQTPDTGRNLALEHKLKEIEDKFILLRDRKLIRHEPLTAADRYTLAVFVSTAFARTKRQKEDGKQIWRDYIDMVENLPPGFSQAVKARQDYQDVLRLHKDQPLLFHLYQFVNTTAPYIYSLNCAIYETALTPGIITSDNPCMWFDPAILLPETRPTYFGLGSPTLNVLFPISPRQYVSFEKNGPDGYIELNAKPDLEEQTVNLFNNLTVHNCDEWLVVSEKTINDEWFENEAGKNLDK